MQAVLEKSSILYIMGLLDRPTEGEVFFEGGYRLAKREKKREKAKAYR